MGLYTSTGIAPFAVTVWEGGDNDLFGPNYDGKDYTGPEALHVLLIWHEWDEDQDEMDPRTFRGWTFDPRKWVEIEGLYYYTVVHEDGRQVLFINEDDNECVGGITATFVHRDDPTVLRAFLDETGLSGEIHHPQAVKQTS